MRRWGRLREGRRPRDGPAGRCGVGHRTDRCLARGRQRTSGDLPVHQGGRSRPPSISPPGKVRVITRFNLADFAEGVSDVAALRILLDAGARVKAYVNFTPNSTLSARAGRSSPQPTSRSRRWTATPSLAWWLRMRRSSRPDGPISTTFGVAGETTSCAIRSMPRRKPYPPSHTGRTAGQTNRSRGFRGRCRHCRSAARSGVPADVADADEVGRLHAQDVRQAALAAGADGGIAPSSMLRPSCRMGCGRRASCLKSNSAMYRCECFFAQC